MQLTVENDVVTGLTVTNQAADPTSKNFQDLFILGINSLVVGKSLDSLTAFSAVNGSSLTPIGFNAALVTVKAQARVQAS
ncbi:MAG: hypothetical protein ACD_28C00246G0001 [uncultured bacterium]|nr:MAG: hypothetical protein ACD_28C00246G0001 [uncultured bacterium]